MSVNKKQRNEAFTKIAGKLLYDVRDLVEWGVEGGHTTPEKLRLTIAARREQVNKMIEAGMSQRQAAKVFGVGLGTVQRDLTRSGSKMTRNGSPKTQRRKHMSITAPSKAETLLDQIDKENPEAPFLAYTFRASDSWQLAQQAATMLPWIIEHTKPCPEDWTMIVELTRKAADEWTMLATKLETTTAPPTRRTKRITAT